jgi:hypothetical protein
MARKSRKNRGEAEAAATERAPYRAAGYVRLSRDDTKKRGDSIENQRNIICPFMALAKRGAVVPCRESRGKPLDLDCPYFPPLFAVFRRGQRAVSFSC